VKNKRCTAQEAVQLIQDNDTVTISGFIRAMVAEEVINALETRFMETGSPRDLTLIHGAAASDFGNDKLCGLNNLAHDGLLKRTISGYYGHGNRLKRMINENRLESYNFPLGVVTHLLRQYAQGNQGELTKIGLKTYVDPRREGGRMNAVSQETYVKLMEFEGAEYLYYSTPKPNVAMIRGTTADEFGNITFEDEALYSLAKVAAMATKQNGGTVICQVKNYVKGGCMDAQSVCIPGIFVDKIVVCSDPERLHRQTAGIFQNPANAGHYKVAGLSAPILQLDARKVIARRAAMELTPGDVVNLGIGMPECISAVADEEQFADQLVLTVETGAIAGVPLPGASFGATANTWALVHEDRQFDLYDGGGLDIAFLGLAETGQNGDVNVSKFNGQIMGCGGFIDITQPTKTVVFCGTFTAGGLEESLDGGRLTILKEGCSIKFKNSVEQVTFSGEYAVERGQKVLYVTERGVFRLTADGLELFEIAPGVDINRDIFAYMEFTPKVSEHLKLMDERLFSPELVGIREMVLAKGEEPCCV